LSLRTSCLERTPSTSGWPVSRIESKGITGRRVAAQERGDLYEIQLSVGEITSTIELQASAVHVAADNSDG